MNYVNLGMRLSKDNCFVAARAAFVRALQEDRRPGVLANYANTLRRIYDYPAAEAAIKESLAVNPTRGRSWWIDGMIALDQKQYARAIESLERAHATHPEIPDIEMALCIAYLSNGDYLKGFKAAAIRHVISEPVRTLENIPLWRGENLAGKRLLIDCEQGFGDMVMFSRFAALFEGEVIMRSPPPLVRFLRGQGYPAISKACEVKADYRVMIMDVPAVLGIDECLPPPPPNPPELITLGSKKKLNIGIVWRSKSMGAEAPEALYHGAQKSCDIEHFMTLAEIPGVQLYSLQFGQGAGDISRAYDLVQPLMIWDFEDLASYIQQLDLVVSVDTAPIHVCGALNKPGIVMLNYVGSWQWQAKETTPWYPSLKIVRQPAPNDWAGAFAECRKLVEAML